MSKDIPDMRWTKNNPTDASLGELMADPAGDDADTTEIPPVAASPRRNHPEVDADEVDGDETADSFLDDDDFLPQEQRRPHRLTIALVAAVVLAVGCFGGIWVQKQFGTQTAAAGTRTAAAGAPAGFPNGGGQGMPGGAAAGAPGGGASGAPGGAASGASGGSNPGSASGSGDSATPAVVGTVTAVKSRTLVVTDLGDTRHTVTISTSTTLTVPYAHGAVRSGDTVSVVGTVGSDSSVIATGITIR